MTKYRINARIDAPLNERLEHARSKLGKSVTEIIHEALENYLERAERETKSPYDALLSLGLIGCADGPSNLSSDYKSILSESFEGKVKSRARKRL